MARETKKQRSENGKRLAAGKIDYARAAPFAATLCVILAFLFFYYAYFNCEAGCSADNKPARLFACCDRPNLTFLLNSLQEQHRAAWNESLLPRVERVPPSDAWDRPPADPNSERLNPVPYKSVVLSTTYQGHVAWALFAWLFLFAGLATLVLCAYIIRGGGAKRARYMGSGAALVLGLLVVALYGWLMRTEWNQEDLVTQLVNTTVSKDVHNIVTLEFSMDVFGIALAVLLALASSTLLSRPDGDEDLSSLEARSNRLALILYVGALLLVFATLRVNSLLHWSLAFLQPPPWLKPEEAANAAFIYKGAEGLVSNMMAGVGAFCTLLLAAIYVPAALVLSNRAAEAISRGAGAGQKEAAGRQTPLLLEHWLRLAVILGPFVAGPVGDLLSRLR